MATFRFTCLKCERTFDSLIKPYEPIRCGNCGFKEVAKLYDVIPHTHRLFDYLNDVIKVAVKVKNK